MACRLCGNERVYDINSHYTPRAISESTFGKAGKELIHTIDIKTASVETYYGRAHPDAKADVIKPLPNTAKGIFCKKCEDGFGLLESIVQPLLGNAMANLTAEELALSKIEKGLYAFSLPIHINIFNLFFLSVIWRQCLSNEIEVGNCILPVPEFNHLQQCILSEIHKTKQQIEASNNFSAYPLVTPFTAPFRKETSAFVNPSGFVTNPELFFIGDYSCLYFKAGMTITPKIFKIQGTPFSLQQISGDRTAHTRSRVIVIDTLHYDNILHLAANQGAHLFLMQQIENIALARNIGRLTAEYYLKRLAMQFYIQNGMQDYMGCLLRAAESLCH